MTLDIQTLNKKQHDRTTFDCGITKVNDFLQHNARQNMEAMVSRTWVATMEHPTLDALTSPVVGYFTLTQGTIWREELPAEGARNSYPRHALPIIKLAWLGVDRKHQRSDARLGETLLLEALACAHNLIAKSGIGVAVVIDPLSDESAQFFRRYGFKPLCAEFNGRSSLFMSAQDIQAVVESG